MTGAERGYRRLDGHTEASQGVVPGGRCDTQRSISPNLRMEVVKGSEPWYSHGMAQTRKARKKATTDLGRSIMQRERQRLAREQAALAEKLAEDAAAARRHAEEDERRPARAGCRPCASALSRAPCRWRAGLRGCHRIHRGAADPGDLTPRCLDRLPAHPRRLPPAGRRQAHGCRAAWPLLPRGWSLPLDGAVHRVGGDGPQHRCRHRWHHPGLRQPHTPPCVERPGRSADGDGRRVGLTPQGRVLHADGAE